MRRKRKSLKKKGLERAGKNRLRKGVTDVPGLLSLHIIALKTPKVGIKVVASSMKLTPSMSTSHMYLLIDGLPRNYSSP